MGDKGMGDKGRGEQLVKGQRVGLHKIRGLALMSRDFKNVPSPLCPPPPFLVKISHPPIIEIFEKFHPLEIFSINLV